MILLRTSDENGKVQFVTVKNDMFYLECKHCGRIFPIGSICEFMEELGNEDFDSEVLDWCEDSLEEKYEREERPLPLDLAVKLAAYYHTSVDYLVGLTDNPEPYP